MTTAAPTQPPTSPASPDGPVRGTARRRGLLGALSGILAAALALGVAELLAGLVGPTSSPVIAVGQGVIRLTPEPVKEFAIRTFGESDKIALLVGTGILLLIAAVVLGVLGTRRPVFGVVGVVLFGLVAVVAALTAPAAPALVWLPSVIGCAAGIVALLVLLRRIGSPPTPTPAAGVAAPAVTVPGAVGGAGAAGRHAAGRPDGRPGLLDNVLGRDRKGAGFDRRGFLVASVATAGIAGVAGGLGRALLARLDVSAARDRLTLPAPASPAAALPAGVEVGVEGVGSFVTANTDFYRVDTALVVPQVDPETYRLRIHGMVDKELELTLDDLLARDLVERDITLTCVSNEVGGKLAGHARWLGVPLKDLLEEAGVADGADLVFTTSSDGWTCGTPVKTILATEGAMLAVAMNGEPLPVEHGFPVRMLVPGLYGYVSATKWLVDLELTTADKVAPYWVKRGWELEAPIKVASRIEAPRGLSRVQIGSKVAVAGVAWAQTRGIERVECRVDGGPWQPARLAAVPNDDTWRQWVWEWTPEKAGLATLEVRATDGDGTVQTGKDRPIFPDGSTGWHDVVVTVA